jgi:hypothetical protein
MNHDVHSTLGIVLCKMAYAKGSRSCSWDSKFSSPSTFNPSKPRGIFGLLPGLDAFTVHPKALSIATGVATLIWSTNTDVVHTCSQEKIATQMSAQSCLFLQELGIIFVVNFLGEDIKFNVRNSSCLLWWVVVKLLLSRCRSNRDEVLHFE